jgi:hypothetical protein
VICYVSLVTSYQNTASEIVKRKLEIKELGQAGVQV